MLRVNVNKDNKNNGFLTNVVQIIVVVVIMPPLFVIVRWICICNKLFSCFYTNFATLYFFKNTGNKR